MLMLLCCYLFGFCGSRVGVLRLWLSRWIKPRGLVSFRFSLFLLFWSSQVDVTKAGTCWSRTKSHELHKVVEKEHKILDIFSSIIFQASMTTRHETNLYNCFSPAGICFQTQHSGPSKFPHKLLWASINSTTPLEHLPNFFSAAHSTQNHFSKLLPNYKTVKTLFILCFFVGIDWIRGNYL